MVIAPNIYLFCMYCVLIFQHFSYKKDELGALKAKVSKLENEKASLQEDNQRLEQKVFAFIIRLLGIYVYY